MAFTLGFPVSTFTCLTEYTSRQKSLNQLLRLLVENEVTRLNVWSNPHNDPRRGADHIIIAERNFVDVGTQWFFFYFWLILFLLGLMGSGSSDCVAGGAGGCYSSARAFQESICCKRSASTGPF